jgi:hypothetical protein
VRQRRRRRDRAPRTLAALHRHHVCRFACCTRRPRRCPVWQVRRRPAWGPSRPRARGRCFVARELRGGCQSAWRSHGPAAGRGAHLSDPRFVAAQAPKRRAGREGPPWLAPSDHEMARRPSARGRCASWCVGVLRCPPPPLPLPLPTLSLVARLLPSRAVRADAGGPHRPQRALTQAEGSLGDRHGGASRTALSALRSGVCAAPITRPPPPLSAPLRCCPAAGRLARPAAGGPAAHAQPGVAVACRGGV